MDCTERRPSEMMSRGRRGLRWSQPQMHRVAYKHVGVQGATAVFEGFAQPVRVGQVVLFTEATGIAVMATLDSV
jgi:hypothetical protein